MQTLDDLIEEIAKALCVEAGIDPYGNVSHGYLDAMTTKEINEWYKTRTTPGVPLVGGRSPAWRTYRATAADIISKRKIMMQFAEKIDAQIEQETRPEA